LRSDVPVGTFLSGGIDSSCVVAMLARLNGGSPVRTFSVGYEGLGIDERPYALRISEMYKSDHRELFLTVKDIGETLKRIVWYMDEPIGDSAAVPTFLLSEMARQSGVKVVLNGTGGDEVFGGYARYIIRGSKGYKYALLPFFNSAVSLFMHPLRVNTAINVMDKLINYLCRINGSFIGLRYFLKDESWFNILLNGINDVMGSSFDSLKNVPEDERLMFFD